ncbi:glycosyltransferase family A protein [Parvibaculum sp.]|uniref:glycosyltransferase family 2 protein n=1 Tax=Parvibaculum sp. TaxID=2024848 RepID=UPI000C8961DE|nr:glycosyltransferase family A protein [Parvibaculum sp.]MAB15390.1 hypothetical protein [Parvibaculum sp.]
MPPSRDVTVIVTCYNLEDYIQSAIESVLAQSAIDHIQKVLVVDDGSKDRSREKIEEYASRDPKVVPIFKENGGASSARNAGLARARGVYVAFLDGDDIWHANMTERQLAAAAEFPRAGLYVSDFLEVNEEQGISRVHWAHGFTQDDPDTLKTLFAFSGPILPSTSMIRRSAFDDCGGFNEQQKYMNDTEMWLRLAQRVSFHRIPEVLATKRTIANSISSNFRERVEARRELGRRVLEWRPDLVPWADRWAMKTEIEAGLAAIELGAYGEARASFCKAVRLRLTDPLPWFYMLVSLLPGDPRGRLAFGKNLTTGLRKKLRTRQV